MVRDDLYYTKEHEWAKVEGDTAIVGITDYAQSELGDILYVELPSVGKTVSAGDVLATVEAVKAVSDVYAPLSGEVIEVNEALSTTPEVINKDPYGEGWMVKIKISNPDEVNQLLSPADYRNLIGE
ncbi:MAG TPA: glycine cleavage system protein GcvH [candidate division Zixibacteria bacterium]|nr:glycine cleavage system protein GcvH [candidate division Zixibacteria bacterium]